ncbi:MAG TPA: M20/M25/M40 family metallo-hydrolase [Myxococcaceae bacterium]|nr:M20/M25/M40 family metallo-hydrolase [Myxococcaceae bacterium]
MIVFRPKSLLAVVCLLCAGGALARGADPEVWISIGADSLPAVQQALGASAAPTDRVGNVVLLHVRESMLPLIGQVMHDRFNRCAGFRSHPSRNQALAEVATGQTQAELQQAAIQPLAVNYTVDNAAVVNGLIGQLTAPNVESTITGLAAFYNRYYTAQTGVDAANWLKSRWQTMAAGRSDVTVDLFPHTWAQPSVIMTIQGTTFPGEVVVLGGHLDSINVSNTAGQAPGADDDASGVASLTEVIRAAMVLNYRPQRTVKFMAYAAEEVGLRGSAAIASSYQSQGVNVIGAFQLDMTNYKGSTFDMGMVTDNTNAAQNNFVTTLITTYGGGLTYTTFACGYACSDHASWTNIGVPSSLPFEATISTDNPYIHSANDTYANCGSNSNHALKFSKIAAAYMAELAKGDFNGTGPTGSIATYDATLKAPKCGAAGAWCDSGSLLNGRAGLGPETNQPNTIGGTCADGTSGTFHSDESNDWIRVSTTDGTNMAAGKTVKVEARVWAYSTYTDDKLDLYYAANANSPSWTFLATLAPAAAGSQTLSTTYVLPSGALQAVRAQFRYQGTVGSCTAGSYIDHDDLAFAVEGGTPDTTPPAVSITAPANGSTVNGTVTISANATDNVGVTQVDFLVDGVVKGSDTSSPYSFAWDSTTASNGSHSLTARAADGAGNSATSAAVSVTVSNSGVAWDSVLKAPKCGAVGSVCDSGTLLTGRNTLGPELNKPNTINGSCADGASGTFHSDESNDRLKVSTTDGTSFAAGKTVRVDATVWAYSTFSSDKLDLYYAANANSPTWTLIGTLSPTVAGSQTLSATYTLPAGTLQAVRARFRYQGTAGSCGTGAYDDHDDLIFAAQ